VRVHAYIDGFNLYHGAIKGRPGCKWVDLRKLCASLLPPTGELGEIHYFTARLKEPGKAQRQDVYLRALRGECAPFFCRKGRFRRKTLVLPRADDGTEVTVRLLQEKQSDVNLAIKLVADACDQRMEAALVVTDDSDLEGALRMVREECCLYLIVASPRGRRGLATAVRADLWRAVQEDLLRGCQLPDPSIDDEGWEVFRPKSWGDP
jgi:hypothetical protein